jgi:hypothetical protein
MQLSPSREAASCAATQELPNILWKPKVLTRALHWSLSWARSIQSITPPLFVTFRNKIVYGELLAPRPTPKPEDHPLSTVRDCLFNIFAATLHIWRPSPPSATWRHAMVWWQGTHLVRCLSNLRVSISELTGSNLAYFYWWRNGLGL